jgi:hypothetical protein
LGNIPFLLAERGCSNREEYFKTAQTDFQLSANCVRRCPLFAKLRFANSPLVALLSIGRFRPLRRSTNAARRPIRGRFLKKATQKL